MHSAWQKRPRLPSPQHSNYARYSAGAFCFLFQVPLFPNLREHPELAKQKQANKERERGRRKKWRRLLSFPQVREHDCRGTVLTLFSLADCLCHLSESSSSYIFFFFFCSRWLSFFFFQSTEEKRLMTFVKWLQTLPSTENYLFLLYEQLQSCALMSKRKKNCLFSFDTHTKKTTTTKRYDSVQMASGVHWLSSFFFFLSCLFFFINHLPFFLWLFSQAFFLFLLFFFFFSFSASILLNSAMPNRFVWSTKTTHTVFMRIVKRVIFHFFL